MFFSRISFKIGIWYAFAFLLSALLLFALNSYLLIQSLKSKDHDLLTEKVHEYEILYARDGIRGLQLRVSSKEIKHARDFVVRLASADGKTLFIHSPDRSGDDDAPQLTDIDEFLSKSQIRDGFIIIPASDFGDDVELVSKTLPSGEVLQVGKDTEDREAFFQSFSEAYFQGLVPILLFAVFIGGFLSKRFLKPIRGLTQTVESIRSGNQKARVQLGAGKDELWQLGHLFNQMLEQNEHLVQGMRETVDNVAHDLRTPVMRLQNAVEGALRGEAEIERFREALIDAKENSETILKLVDAIMDISEAEAGTLRLRKELLTSKEVIEGAMDLYGFVAEEKKILLASNFLQVFNFSGDHMRLLQVVANLIDNAIKYSPEGSKVLIQSIVADGDGSIRVIDEGSGIDAKDLPRIWDRLYRADLSRSTRGLGLGLSLVRAVVQAHGGTVSVMSNAPERGTTFTVSFKITEM